MKDAPRLHAFEYTAFSSLRGLLTLLPHRTSRALGRGLGDLAWAVLGRRRRVTLDNLERALPELGASERRRIARESFRNLGRMACDTISSHRFDSREVCKRLTLAGWENFASARDEGRGVLVMSAHLGSWEMAAHAVGLYGEPMHVIGRPLDNPRIDQSLSSQRKRFGNQTIPKRGAARGSMRVLRGKGVVGILIDQRVRPEQGILVPFFGHNALTSPLLARLALRTGAPIVPLFGELAPGGRYRIEFEEAIESPPDGEDAVEELTRRCLEVVERRIRRAPEQWLWLHERWKRYGSEAP